MYIEPLAKALKDALLTLSQRSERAASTLEYATHGRDEGDAQLIRQVVADLQQQADQLRRIGQSLY